MFKKILLLVTIILIPLNIYVQSAKASGSNIKFTVNITNPGKLRVISVEPLKQGMATCNALMTQTNNTIILTTFTCNKPAGLLYTRVMLTSGVILAVWSQQTYPQMNATLLCPRGKKQLQLVGCGGDNISSCSVQLHIPEALPKDCLQ